MISKLSFPFSSLLRFSFPFLCWQNVIAWTNLGVLYLKHGKIEVGHSKSDTEPIFCLLLVIDQKCGTVAFV